MDGFNERTKTNPLVAYGGNLLPLGFAAFYFGAAIYSSLTDFLVRIGFEFIILTIFAARWQSDPGPLLFWILIHFVWGSGYLFMGRWRRWLLTVLPVLASSSVLIAVAGLTGDGLEHDSLGLRGTESTQFWAIVVGLFSIVVVLLTTIDTRRLLRRMNI